jgi:hypothetical protein
MSDTRAIQEPTSLTSATGASFEQELRDLLRQRTRLMLTVVLVVAVVAQAVNAFLVAVPSAIQTGLVPWKEELRLLHIVSLAVALLLTYSLKGKARQFQLLAFWVVAFNMILAMAVLASESPAEEPYLVCALTLFLYAAFIPSPARYPIILALVAVAGFDLSAVLTYAYVPEAQGYWADWGTT